MCTVHWQAQLLHGVTLTLHWLAALAKCTETNQLSLHGLFINQDSVLRQIAVSKLCFMAKLGFLEIQVAALAA